MKRTSREFSDEPPDSTGLLDRLRALPASVRVRVFSQTLVAASLAEAARIGPDLAAAAPEILNRVESSPRSGWLSRWKSWRGRVGYGAARIWFDAAVRSWAAFDSDTRRALCAAAPGDPRWAEAARDALTAGPDPRRSVAILAGEVGDPGLVRVAIRLLEDPDAADDAERAVIAAAALGSTLAGGQRAELESVIADAARSFSVHRRRGVFTAAIVLLDPRQSADTPLRRWVLEDQHESHGVLRSTLRRATDPLSRARAWWWLGGRARGIAAAALDRVAVSHGPGDDEAVLRDAHILATPERARRMRLVTTRRAGGGVLPRAEALAGLSARAQRGLARFVGALSMKDDARAAVLEPLRGSRDPAARFLAMRATDGASLQQYAGDADERVARSARLRLEFGAETVRSEQGSVTRVEEWRALRRDREAFVRDLRSRVLRGDRPGRIAAITRARRMRLVPEIELDLLPLLQPSPGADDHVAAAAVTALGDVQRDSARTAVRACLSHPAARVRANAVESWCRLVARGGGEPAAPIVELKNDPHHRVRAGAARACLLHAAGGGDVSPMLGDDRPLHRLAGLWLVERVLTTGLAESQWDALASRVADLARSDPEVVVRERAAACGRRLLNQVRDAWAGRAREVRP